MAVAALATIKDSIARVESVAFEHRKIRSPLRSRIRPARVPATIAYLCADRLILYGKQGRGRSRKR